MAESILAIIAMILPVLFSYLDERKKEQPHVERQKILAEIAGNDMGALTVRVDRLRTERRLHARQQQALQK